jgi:hypothetical protein
MTKLTTQASPPFAIARNDSRACADKMHLCWSTRKRQTGTGVFCLLFVGPLNSKNFQHLTQINNAHMLVKVFNNLWRTSTAKVTIL